MDRIGYDRIPVSHDSWCHLDPFPAPTEWQYSHSDRIATENELRGRIWHIRESQPKALNLHDARSMGVPNGQLQFCRAFGIGPSFMLFRVCLFWRHKKRIPVGGTDVFRVCLFWRHDGTATSVVLCTWSCLSFLTFLTAQCRSLAKQHVVSIFSDGTTAQDFWPLFLNRRLPLQRQIGSSPTAVRALWRRQCEEETWKRYRAEGLP